MAPGGVGLGGGCTALHGIDTVAVVVADRRRALAWYRDVLGLEAAYVPPEAGHWIEVGPKRPRARLHLWKMGGSTEPGPTGITLITGDIQAEFHRLKDRGVNFLTPPRLEEWDEWLCAFTDPDGNEFDLKQPADRENWRR
jgi:catechol 2,3-dioxygenase-like lactoylglutathione lyase family enzyme